MSSLWSAAATNEGIFAKGFSTASKKKPRLEREPSKQESPRNDEKLANLFRVKADAKYSETLDGMKQHVIDLLNMTDPEFTLEDFGGA